MKVYLDNAATTPMDPVVIERMASTMKEVYGNPSAIHAIGRTAKSEIELARRSIAKWLHCSPSEIFFTSSGTEADNMALRCSVNDLGVTSIITSMIEHKAVLDTARDLEAKGQVKVLYVDVDEDGRANLAHLANLAMNNTGALISLMHANNEIGTLNNIAEISKIARDNACYFHSDTVQTMGHYSYDLESLQADFLTCSAHKFHGPKGVGFLYKNKRLQLKPLLTGGGQESKFRPGTENVIGIVGMAEAMNQAYTHLDSDMKTLNELKKHLKTELSKTIEGLSFNGDTSEDGSLYTVLNISFPPYPGDSTLLYQLDIEGICVSGGSACNSGALNGSHVLEGINSPTERSAVRFSFSKFNTLEQIDHVIDIVGSIVKTAQAV